MSNRNLAKNTVFYSLALAGQKVLSFIYFIFLARSIGVENQGKFSFALSFTSVFAMFLDFGLTQILIRETAKKKENAQNYLANVMGFKILASVIIYFLIVVLVNLMGYSELTRQLVYISGFVMLLDSLSLSVYGVIRGYHNLFFESLGTIINQLTILIVGLFGLWAKWNLQMLMSIYLLGSLINFFWSAYNLNRKFSIKLQIKFDRLVIYNLFKFSLPFAIAGIFSRIFSSIDTILLSKLTGDWAVGIYSVAFKAVFALQFLALAFSASLYPAFSNYFVNSKKELSKLFVKSMYWLIIFSLPLAFGTIIMADKVVGIFFGQDYLPSVIPLQILMTSMIFVFLCFPIGSLLNACNKQSRNTINTGIVALFSFIANLILIPWLGYNGSALANLLSYLLLFILGIVVVQKIIDYDKKFLLITLIKALLACILMCTVIIMLKESLYFIIVIFLGALVYAICAYLLKLFSVKLISDFIKEFIR